MAEKTETTILDESAVSEIEARYEIATAGPWFFVEPHGIALARGPQFLRPMLVELPDRVGPLTEAEAEQIKADYSFMAHARSDIPALCATVKHLRAENEQLRTSFAISEAYRGDDARVNQEIRRSLQSQLEQLRVGHRESEKQLREWQDKVVSLMDRLAQVEQERDALRDSASIVAFKAHQIDGKIAESLIEQGRNDFRTRIAELCKSKAAEREAEAGDADMRLRSSERDVIENEARAIKELAAELEKL